jgi:hypothetical protein
MRHQQHPDGLKAKARTIFEAHGSRRASEQTGIPRRTVNAWARAEGWQRRLATGQRPDLRVAPDAPLPTGAAVTPKRPASSGNPAGLQHDLLVEVAACLAQLGKDRVAGKSGAVRNWAWAIGVLIDKATGPLAKGGAGWDRPAPLSPEESVARIRTWLDVAEGKLPNGHHPGEPT